MSTQVLGGHHRHGRKAPTQDGITARSRNNRVREDEAPIAQAIMK